MCGHCTDFETTFTLGARGTKPLRYLSAGGATSPRTLSRMFVIRLSQSSRYTIIFTPAPLCSVKPRLERQKNDSHFVTGLICLVTHLGHVYPIRTLLLRGRCFSYCISGFLELCLQTLGTEIHQLLINLFLQNTFQKVTN